MKSIILARVSTEEQRKDGQSIPAQLSRSRDYVANKGLELFKEYEFDESSTKDKRVKFDAIIDDVKKSKECIALVVETIDRLQRSYKESVLLDEFRKQGKVELHFIRENLVIKRESNSSDILRWDMGVMFAKSYVLQLSDNVKRSLAMKIENGEVTGNVTIGYINKEDDQGKKYVIADPLRAPMIKKAFELYASGAYSLEQIVQVLAADGLKNKTKNGKPVNKSQLDQILKNPFYYGVMRNKGKLYPHKYEPIIEKWLFDKCQEVRDKRHGRVFKYNVKPFVFRSMIRCATCGCMIGKDPKKGINYCVCNEYRGKHGAKRVTEEDLIKQVSVAFANIKVPDDVKADLTIRIEKAFEAEQSYFTTSVSELRKEFDENAKMLKESYLDKLKKIITSEQYEEVAKDLNKRQKEINNSLNDHTDANEEFMTSSNYILELANNAQELFESSEAETKRLLINLVLSNLQLKEKTLLWDYKKPFDAMFVSHKNQFWLGDRDSNPN